MEVLKLLWTITFFFFTLILIFIWSKVIVISNKLKAVSSLIEVSEKVELDEDETITLDEAAELDSGENKGN